jgi:CheY-like chemotaxis protein
LVLDLAPEPVFVSGDEKRLVQILTNLLNNAGKYTRDGGRVHVRIEADERHVSLHIRDNGIGISPELQTRVFDLFAQAERTPDRSQGGLGLGLALVKSLVELHDGTVTCFSEGLNRGSCFTVTLPRLAEDHQAIWRQEKTLFRPASKKLDILVVDDNADAAQMLMLLLEASGHAVTVEDSPLRALGIAQAGTPDVCILDIGLPQMNGNELARLLRKRPAARKLTLIALTGYGQELDRNTAFEAGFDYYLVKPVDTSKLFSILAKVREG